LAAADPPGGVWRVVERDSPEDDFVVPGGGWEAADISEASLSPQIMNKVMID